MSQLASKYVTLNFWHIFLSAATITAIWYDCDYMLIISSFPLHLVGFKFWFNIVDFSYLTLCNVYIVDRIYLTFIQTLMKLFKFDKSDKYILHNFVCKQLLTILISTKNKMINFHYIVFTISISLMSQKVTKLTCTFTANMFW